MIDIFNSAFGWMFEAGLHPFRALNPWFALAAVSLATAVFMLLVYRVTSNPARIRRIKDRIIAHLLEIRLYKHNLPATFHAQGSILWWNLKYLSQSAKPMLVIILPLVLVLLQLDLWFGYEPLKPGESAIVRVWLRQEYHPSRMSIALIPPGGVEPETPPLRIDAEKEVDWRVRAIRSGVQEIGIRVGDEIVTKSVVVEEGAFARVSPARVAPGLFDQLVNPGEQSIAALSPVRRIEIDLAPRAMNVFGWRVHWLIVYFVLSVAFGFALRRPFGVEL